MDKRLRHFSFYVPSSNVQDMRSSMEDNNCGVIYKEKDYVGLWRRMLIVILDLVVIALIFIIGFFLESYFYAQTVVDDLIFSSYICVGISFFYLTIVKSSKLGTLGQIITRTKIIDLKGKRPNAFQMVFRLLLWLFGPVNFIYDFAFIGFNSEKRTLRDCLSDTIVVYKKSVPIATNGKIGYSRVFVFGFNILYARVNTGVDYHD